MLERRENYMEFDLKRVDGIICIKIGDITIPGVENYKIITSASGETEVMIKLKFKSSITELNSSNMLE